MVSATSCPTCTTARSWALADVGSTHMVATASMNEAVAAAIVPIILRIASPPCYAVQRVGARGLTPTGVCCGAMSARRRLCAIALVAAALLPASRAARADETSPANVAAARKHFEKARADYAQGAYREAIGELEAAHSLDPNAKDLVFNLGVVHEKLADIDEALKWFRLYTSMNLTAAERDRADAY